jgi:hypothetical protein
LPSTTRCIDDVDEVVDVDEVAPRVHHEARLALGQAVEERRQRPEMLRGP